jgi:replication factor C subunit 3/5
MKSGIPFVELYRPQIFDDIVLEPLNKQILKNIIETSYFPNLLFYGPPGTGKTTTIINLINAYQEKINNKNKDLIIHLNASDERGIDTIRNQINFFVTSKPLFNNGMKFIILDEVDYMTKNAQQALRYLLHSCCNNVRFCLICNYISKIDEGLQNEFIRLPFNQLPKEDIINFLTKIIDNEKLNLSHYNLSCIQQLYKSDIRSMLNFIQSNQDFLTDIKIINNNLWFEFIQMLKNQKKMDTLHSFVQNISSQYNIDKKTIIKNFLNYIINNHSEFVNIEFLNFVENLLHSQIQKNDIFVNYSLIKLSYFLSL